jgi:hypothetical protein
MQAGLARRKLVRALTPLSCHATTSTFLQLNFKKSSQSGSQSEIPCAPFFFLATFWSGLHTLISNLPRRPITRQAAHEIVARGAGADRPGAVPDFALRGVAASAWLARSHDAMLRPAAEVQNEPHGWHDPGAFERSSGLAALPWSPAPSAGAAAGPAEPLFLLHFRVGRRRALAVPLLQRFAVGRSAARRFGQQGHLR